MYIHAYTHAHEYTERDGGAVTFGISAPLQPHQSTLYLEIYTHTYIHKYNINREMEELLHSAQQTLQRSSPASLSTLNLEIYTYTRNIHTYIPTYMHTYNKQRDGVAITFGTADTEVLLSSHAEHSISRNIHTNIPTYIHAINRETE
jgi:hypothetical protein